MQHHTESEILSSTKDGGDLSKDGKDFTGQETAGTASIRLWNEQHTVSSSDSDYAARLKLSVLLDWMQNAADAHLESMGHPSEELIRQGLGWMLLTMEIDLKYTPVNQDQLSLETWSKGTRGVAWLRDYRIRSQQDEPIISAKTVWSLVDIHKRRILRPSALPFEVPVNPELSEGPQPEKVSIPEGILLREAYTFTIRYSGTDMNGHLNNARYGDLCYDALTPEELDRQALRTFRISYLNEAQMGEVILIERSETQDDKIWIRGTGQDQRILFQALMVMKEEA
ncbi:thioesterase [Paenibacillus sp. JX-17]|uniref:Thioesterase n=1 Tax=Paenibacillus lacisoli TaxID=3064525 RepID=A0ABT9CDL8_9BACL|nr:acyl-ACP thioesterase domain-containing protein [Paenibacillus sp. JX-17]MDO7905698.1 thioesterase [Paenibacillus sp. JX-17]